MCWLTIFVAYVNFFESGLQGRFMRLIVWMYLGMGEKVPV